MKKIVLYGAILVLVSVIAIPSVFAGTNNDSKVIDFFRSKLTFHRDQIHQALDQGEITQEEADKWNGHFDYMEEFHEENGFRPGMMDNKGHCVGRYRGGIKKGFFGSD